MNNKNQKPQKPKSTLKQVAALSGIAIQMGIIIYLFVLLGRWLDTTYNNGDKLYIIITTLLGITISLYLVIKQANRINN